MYELIGKKFTATWGGILRISLWTIFFIWAAGFIMPRDMKETLSFKSAEGPGLTPMLSYFPDQRLMREDVSFDPTAVNIAWVCDSTCVLAPHDKKVSLPDADYYTYTQQSVLKNLVGRFPGKKIHIYLYAALGTFPADQQAMISKVLSQQPDVVVFHLNILSIYNVNNFNIRDRSKPTLEKLWLKSPQMRILPFALVPPAQQLYVVTNGFLPAVREMVRYKSGLRDDVKRGAEDSEGKGATKKPVKGNDTQQAIDPLRQLGIFWRLHDPAISMTRGGVRVEIYPGLPDPSSYSYITNAETLKALAESGIPSLAYPTVLAPFYRKDPAVALRLRSIGRTLHDMQEVYKGSRLVVVDRIPDGVADKVSFKYGDPTHQEEGGDAAFISYLSDRIAAAIEEADELKRGKHAKVSH